MAPLDQWHLGNHQSAGGGDSVQIAEAFLRAYRLGGKSLTVFQSNSQEQQVPSCHPPQRFYQGLSSGARLAKLTALGDDDKYFSIIRDRRLIESEVAPEI